jgi:DNA-directed RNA polymerase specialized sigma24 family protein
LEEAVLRLYERRDAIMFSHSGQIGKWLIVTSRNYCMDQIKHLFGPSNRKPSSIQAAWLLGMDSTSPIFVGHLDLGKFLRKLSLDDRNILFAKYYLGMTSKEIGERNNLDPSHIRTKISRLLGAAKQELKNTSKSDKKTKKKSINLKAKGGITDE